MKNKNKFLIIALLSFSCVSYQNFNDYNNENSKYNSNSKQLVLNFNNFENYPLLLDIYFYKMNWKSDTEFDCSDLFQELHINQPKDLIIPIVGDTSLCAQITLKYNTLRPFQKNESAILNLNLFNRKDCLKLDYKSDLYPQNLECKYLDFSKNSTKIIFNNIIYQKIDIDKTFLTYGLTFLSLVAQTPTSYLAPIPMSISGYKTVKNSIHFVIEEI
ncbi:hypothetical protein LPTSP2_04670 [Leptospira ellinghausenii]|uniref:Lipoprotein n=1 Tax=Leptospira ellinghausenii TaxID=1917822 RepID=A0A2P2D996_9LEPT|nr:hypothetical protein [Leptospira ellinghausenii]GBF41195.1 hypothetical protein LPTSP2_04670 [Leptospira ellinghausenii]